MISPKQKLQVRLVLLAARKITVLGLSKAVLLDMTRDLGILAQWVHPIKDQIYHEAKQYKEICVGCMDYTGKADSYDVIDLCPKCNSPVYSLLGHTLGLFGVYSIERRVLSQIIYQALEGENLNDYRG